jgi:hypothetical protein
MRAQHPGEFLGVSRLMDDDVAHRPGFTPGAGVGPALLHRIDKGPTTTPDYAASGL